MHTSEHASPRTGRRFVAVVAATLVAFVLLAVALVYSSAAGATRVAENARQLHLINATAGSAALARAAISQAVVFGVDREFGVASDAAVADAIAEASSNLAVVSDWRDALADSGGFEETIGAASAFIASGRQVLEAVEAGDPVAAETLRRDDLEGRYEELVAVTAARQESITGRIAANEDLSGVVSTITQVLVTLLIPATAIGIYWALARRQVREANLRMESRLAAEREINRAKDRFIAGISHELRTPLTSIYGFSEYLIDTGLVDPSEALELIGLINRESSELARMVDDLLVAARLESGTLTFLEDRLVASEEIAAVLDSLGHGSRAITIDGHEAVVVGDAERVRQVLRNLVSNAVRHGGRQVRIVVAADDDTVQITVADDGDGVDPALEDRLFSRFSNDIDRTLLSGSVGLGLAVAEALCREMGGSLRYVRALGWTSFVVALPGHATADVIAERTDPGGPVTEEDPDDLVVRFG